MAVLLFIITSSTTASFEKRHGSRDTDSFKNMEEEIMEPQLSRFQTDSVESDDKQNSMPEFERKIRQTQASLSTLKLYSGLLRINCSDLPCETFTSTFRMILPAVVSIEPPFQSSNYENWAPKLVFYDKDSNKHDCVQLGLHSSIIIGTNSTCAENVEGSINIPSTQYLDKKWIHMKMTPIAEGLNIEVYESQENLLTVFADGKILDVVSVVNVTQVGYSPLVLDLENPPVTLMEDSSHSSSDVFPNRKCQERFSDFESTTDPSSDANIMVFVTLGTVFVICVAIIVVFLIKYARDKHYHNDVTSSNTVMIAQDGKGQQQEITITLTPQLRLTIPHYANSPPIVRYTLRRLSGHSDTVRSSSSQNQCFSRYPHTARNDNPTKGHPASASYSSLVEGSQQLVTPYTEVPGTVTPINFHSHSSENSLYGTILTRHELET